MINFVPIIVCLVGLIVYAISNNGKAQEMGRIAYAMGLLVVLLRLTNV